MSERTSVERATEALVVASSDGGRRLDEFLAATLAIGRRAAMRLVPRVRVNGRHARKGQHLHAGDVLELPGGVDDDALAAGGGLEVVRGDDQVLVLAKPAGLPSVALRGSATDSLAARIVARFAASAALGRPGEAGLVHRLDTGTSGLLLAARSAAAYRSLRAQFAAHELEKEYLALVAGRLATPLRITTPIGQHRAARRRMRALAEPASPRRYAAQPAETMVAVERALGDVTLVRARTRTGVRHQIRVHLASVGHPLLNDPQYGDAKLPELDGFLLHATRLVWHDPTTGDAAVAELAPPAAWQPILDRLADGARAPG
jgi:23S rRNA pseudouridine1911/1915/1917 synthase